MTWLARASWFAVLGLAATLFFIRTPARVAQADVEPDPFFSMNTQFVQAGQTFTVPVQFGTNVTAGTPQRLLTGTQAGQVGDTGQDFALTFSQGLHYADPLLPANETYHLVLTFNAFVVL